MDILDSLLSDAEAWLAQDPDPVTSAELARVIAAVRTGDAEAFGTLRTLFGERLAFGTAGLRGPLRPGPAGMNRVLVAQAAAGFAAYLLDNHVSIDGSNQPSIVIGYDGRHNSDVFARDSAEIMAGAGIRTVLLPEPLPTPVLAFAVRHLGTTAGVMVTASHNPAADNGYKVYLGGAASDPARGAQIISPVDTAIAASIGEIAGTVTIGDLQRSTGYSTEDGSLLAAYIAVTAAVRGVPGPTVPFTYTAMHGVGWRTFTAVLDAAGINQPDLVVDQADPDPDFPTVAFPNPEEIGALDRAFASALVSGSSLVIANDPDADRLAVAIPDDDEVAGFRRLSGNEVGQLLGWRAARLAAASDSPGSTRGNGVLARSLVSSPAIAAVAAHYGLDSVETLTGFKWLSRVPGLVFGYEEALGYLVNPEDLRDKDGISAAMSILALAAELQENGSSIAQHLADFHELFGYHLSEQISLRVTDVAVIAGTMAGLRADPPAAVGGLVVLRVDDLRDGFEDLPPSDVLRFQLDGGSRMIVRPSGTEPKLKIYLDVVGDSADAAEKLLQEVSDGARALLA